MIIVIQVFDDEGKPFKGRDQKRTLHESFEIHVNTYQEAVRFLWRVARKFVAYHKENYLLRRTS